MSGVHACGAFETGSGDPHTLAYCNLTKDHSGPHYSLLKDKVWTDDEEESDG